MAETNTATVKYALLTTTTQMYDDEKGRYLKVAELQKLIDAGEHVDTYATLGMMADNLEDIKTLLRADEIRGGRRGLNSTLISSIKIVKIEEVN
jgi:hypothetical protein